MLRHMLLMKFRPEVAREQQIELTRQTIETLGQIPGVENLIMGPAVVKGQTDYDAALFMDFDNDDEEKYQAYLDNPSHKVAATRIRDLAAEVLVVNCPYRAA